MAKLNRGFTLIELLVVIAIIGVLSTVGLSTFTGAQMKARDARRRADLKAIQTAMEQYYLNSSTYNFWYWTLPITYLQFTGKNYNVEDPKINYVYCGGSCTVSATNYRFCADLETVNGYTKTGWNGQEDICITNLQ